MAIQDLAFLPGLWVLWTCVGIAIALTMTITQGHLITSILYISDLGVNRPESLVFTVVLCVSALLGTGTTYVYYKYMAIRSGDIRGIHPVVHKVMLLIGWMSCGGIMVVAFIQEQYNSDWHYMGAILAFGGAIIYNIGQAVCLYRMPGRNKIIIHLKLAFCLVALCALITIITCKVTLIHGCHGALCQKVNIIAVVAEWILAIGLMLIILTYMPDFQQLCIKWPQKLLDDWICLREALHAGTEYP